MEVETLLAKALALKVPDDDAESVLGDPPRARATLAEEKRARSSPCSLFVFRFARFMKPRIALRIDPRVCISPDKKPIARSNKGGWLSRVEEEQNQLLHSRS